ncbi:PqqD family peptide modification chaperone [Salinibacter altiplanensis]|uniref:PqqD family peptide modification chaperone n=1 Tax=Salinibacter altiplanensis TaxID=1803181 RepID=UPI000C9F995D|nr:PqqD family peptide modification chaperone [Salinibacter altiplanensis]
MESTTLTKSSIVVAAEHQTSTEVDGERVILDLEEGTYYGLDPVGARIWAEMQEPAPVKEIVSAITDEYDVGADQCLEDVIALLRDLDQNGLIEVNA